LVNRRAFPLADKAKLRALDLVERPGEVVVAEGVDGLDPGACAESRCHQLYCPSWVRAWGQDS